MPYVVTVYTWHPAAPRARVEYTIGPFADRDTAERAAVQAAGQYQHADIRIEPASSQDSQNQ